MPQRARLAHLSAQLSARGIIIIDRRNGDGHRSSWPDDARDISIVGTRSGSTFINFFNSIINFNHSTFFYNFNFRQVFN